MSSDGLRRFAVESDAGDDDFAFAALGVALTFRDLPREDDVFEIKYRAAKEMSNGRSGKSRRWQDGVREGVAAAWLLGLRI